MKPNEIATALAPIYDEIQRVKSKDRETGNGLHEAFDRAFDNLLELAGYVTGKEDTNG